MQAIARGLAAGLAGTAAMTAYQEALSSNGGSTDPSWEDAPAPAQVARKAIKAATAARSQPSESHS